MWITNITVNELHDNLNEVDLILFIVEWAELYISIYIFPQLTNNFHFCFCSRFLKQWVMEGITNDPYGEFFIKPDSKFLQSRGRTYWTRSYSLCEDMVPDFLDELKLEVLSCGKAMNLLKCCHHLVS